MYFVMLPSQRLVTCTRGWGIKSLVTLQGLEREFDETFLFLMMTFEMQISEQCVGP